MKKKFKLLVSLLMAMGVMGAASACDVNAVLGGLKEKIPFFQTSEESAESEKESSPEDSKQPDSSSEAPTSSEDPSSSEDSSSDNSSSEDSSSSEDPVVTVPEDGATLTIPQVLALDIEAAAGRKYYVEGTVVRYSDTYKGGLYIRDAEGNELCIYGLQKVYPPYDEGEEPYVEKFSDMFHEDKPWVGATVKFYGEVGAYKDVNQFVDAEFEIIEQPAEDPEAHLPEDGSMLTISDILALEVTGDTVKQFFVEGIVKEIKNTQYGNLYIEDAEGNILYVYGLYDAFTGARFDKMEVQPQVGELVSLRSVISVHDGQIQLKNARLCECRPAPVALNLDGDTVIEIPAGEGAYVSAEATTAAANAAYVISWDDSVTNLVVNYGMIENGDVVEAWGGEITLNFATNDSTALTVTITLTTYVAPPAPELLVGETAVEVTDPWDGTTLQVSMPGTYTLSFADGEANGEIRVEGDWGAELVDVPYTFTVEEGQAFVLIIATANWEADTIDVILTKEGEEVSGYTVTFLNEDGSLISTATYEEGETVVVPDAPTKEADKTYTYEFAGWDSEVATVAAGNATYKATFTATYIDYTVTFVDEEGNEISTATYHYGDEVVAPSAPEKAADNTYTYEFAGWDSEVVAVAGNATYKATFTATYIEYTVAFVNEDGSEISTATYHYGDEVVAPSAPEKAADNTYTYEFAGWDSEVVAVAGNATYKATFTATYIEYTVTFVDADGTELGKDTYHYGDEVAVPNAPVKANNTIYSFEFAGWDSEVVAVAGDATYTATYTATLNEGLKSNMASASTGEGVVLGQSGIGDGANYTKGQQESGFVHQSYLAIDGNYNMDDYIAFDFTGKNMPEIAFFAKNYNDSMYAEGTSKQGIVVYTGITTWDGQNATITQNKPNGTYINYSFPYMIQDAADGGFTRDAFADSKLARANLVDGTHYRVIMGFSENAEKGGLMLYWYLYNIDTKEVVEEASMETWNFFRGSNDKVGNMTINDLAGSIVLYGKFGVETTIDKVWGVYEDTNISAIANGINNNATYTVTFKDADGNVLQTVTDVPFGGKVAYDGELPAAPAADALFTYSYAWDKAVGTITQDTTYTLVVKSEAKSGVKANNVTTNGASVVLGAGGIGDGANYTQGQQVGGHVHQAYLGFDGSYGLNNYIVFDFTGKNLPEVAFFANNYNDSMYAEGTSKQGIVVVTGVTKWDGTLGSGVNGNGTRINYGFPYMIQNAAHGDFCDGALADSALGRANLVDGTHYRVIMGFTGKGNAITLHWCLYNLDTATVVEESSMTTWNFFTGSNEKVGNMTINDLSGSIVLYGKFGTTCTIDAIHGIQSGDFAAVVENAKSL